MASTSAPPEVRARVRVYWPVEQQWFEGTVDRISEQHGVQYFRVSYDDTDVQWHAANETWESLRISKRIAHDHLTSSANRGSTVVAKRIKNAPSLKRGQRISVYWQDEGKWFEGTVRDYDRCSRCHLVVYDDGDQRHEHLEDDPELQWSIRSRAHTGKSKISRGTDGALAVQMEQAVWACCDKCGKWRRLFDTAEEQPEKWQCTDHPNELTCHDPEDEMDVDEQWDGAIAEAAPTEASEVGESESPKASAPSPPDTRQHTPADTSSPTGTVAPRARAVEARAPVRRTCGSRSGMVDSTRPPSTAQSSRRQAAAPEVPALVMTTTDDHKPAELLTMAPPAARATNATTSATNVLPTRGTSQNAYSLRHSTPKLTPPAFANGDLVYVPFDDRQRHLGTVVDWHQRGATAIGRPLFTYSVLFTDGETAEDVGEDEMKPAGPVPSGVEEPVVVRMPTAEQLEKQLEKAPSQLEPLPTASIPRELMVNGAAHCGGDLCFPNLTLADPRLGCRMPVFMMAPGAVAGFSGAKLCHCTTEHHAERSGGCAAHVSFAVQTPALTLGLHKQPSKRAEVETELHAYGVTDSLSERWREAVWLPVWHACDAPSPETRLFHDESLMCALPWRRIVLYDAEKDQRRAPARLDRVTSVRS